MACADRTGLAHHSFSAEFDANQPLKFTGTVTKVEWVNPHAWLYIDVKDETGKVTNWGWEMGSPNSLLRLGWTRNSLKPGEVVTIEGSRPGMEATSPTPGRFCSTERGCSPVRARAPRRSG
jgi:hypothetical protein